MSKRIAISCPDHVYKLLSGLGALQGRPMSKVVVELLEAAYPALNATYMMLVKLEAQKSLAGDSMASNVSSIMGEFKTSVEGMLTEVQLELGDFPPPYSNTGATSSQKKPKTTKLRGV